MDPKASGKLLTNHQRGYGVDVEASVIDSPSGGAPEKAPRWHLLGTEGCGGGNRVSWCSWMFVGYMDIYIGGRSRSVEQRGAHEGRGRAQGVGAPPASWPPR